MSKHTALKLAALSLTALLGCGGEEKSDNRDAASVEIAEEAAAESDAGFKALEYHRVGDSSTRVKVYRYARGHGDQHRVIFKYADLLNRAVQYKIDNPGSVVEVRFALYKISSDLFVGFDPERPDGYGLVNGRDIKTKVPGSPDAKPVLDGEGSEKLVYSILKAKKAGVDLKFVYHNPDDLGALQQYFGSTAASFSRQVNWGPEGVNQMHNKFLTVMTKSPTGRKSYAVYVATSNADAFGTDFKPLFDVAQTGVLVRGNAGLHDAYANYFRYLWDDAYDVLKFRKDVQAAHLRDELNYADANVQAYFFPIPKKNVEPGDDYTVAWVPKYNPIASLMLKMESATGPRHVKMSMYYCGAPTSYDWFSYRVLIGLDTVERVGGGSHIRTAINEGNTESELGSCDVFTLPDGHVLGRGARTHEKNTLFAFGRAQEFYSVTGSANLHRHEYTHKANNLLVLLERTAEHPIYNELKDQFYDVFNGDGATAE